MTTLLSTSPPQLEATALAASTLLLASTALSPKHVWALGFFWVIELAACMPDKHSQPRKKCKLGYAYHYRFKQCLRKKYSGNWELEQIKHAYNPKYTTTRRPTLGEVPISHDDSYSSGSELLGYGDNLGKTPEVSY